MPRYSPPAFRRQTRGWAPSSSGYSYVHSDTRGHKENSFDAAGPGLPRNNRAPLPDGCPMPELYGSNRELFHARQPPLIIETFMGSDPGSAVEKRVRLHQVGQFESEPGHTICELPFIESLKFVRAMVADSWGIDLIRRPFDLVFQGDASVAKGTSTKSEPIIVGSEAEWSLLWHVFPAPLQETKITNFDDEALAKADFSREQVPRKRFEILFREQKEHHLADSKKPGVEGHQSELRDTMARAADPSETVAAPESVTPTNLQSETPTSTLASERPAVQISRVGAQELLSAFGATLAPLLPCVAQQTSSNTNEQTNSPQTSNSDDQRSAARQQAINHGVTLAQQILASVRDSLVQIPATAREQTNAAVSALDTITRVAVPAAASAMASNPASASRQTSAPASDLSAPSLWESFSRPAATADGQQTQSSEPRTSEPEPSNISESESASAHATNTEPATPAIAPVAPPNASHVGHPPSAGGPDTESPSQNETLIQAFERMLSQSQQSQPAGSTVPTLASEPTTATVPAKAESETDSDDSEWIPLNQGSSTSRDPQ